MTQAEGWYPDPAQKAETFRWWDGTAWTRHLSAGPEAPTPTERDVAQAPEGLTDAAEPATEHVAQPTTEPDSDTDPDTDPEDEAHDEPRMRLAVAVGSVVAVLLVALVAVGAVVTASTRELPEGPGVAPGPPPSASVAYDLDSRKARLGEVSATMPGAPYECLANQALVPTFTNATTCDALAVADYRGPEDWYASVGFGLLNEDLAVDGDLRTTVRNVFDSLQKQFYPGVETTASDFLNQELTGIPTTQAVALSGQVHYKIDGLKPRFDKLLMIVVKLKSGEYAAWVSARPDGVSEATLASLNASLNSFAIKR